MIKLSDVSIKYVDKIILENINLEINRGEFISIVGQSGCGKSSILKSIINVVDYEGQIINEFDSIGYCPQDNLLLPFKTVYENALLPMNLNSKKLDDSKIKELFEIFKLSDVVNKYPNEISGGMKSRVALLRTYFMSDSLFILDEPFAAIDMLTKIELQNNLKQLAKQLNLTIILVTHDINEAINLSDYVITIKDKTIKNKYHINTKDIYNLILVDLGIYN